MVSRKMLREIPGIRLIDTYEQVIIFEKRSSHELALRTCRSVRRGPPSETRRSARRVASPFGFGLVGRMNF